ncbi:hypothetical protein EV426DRAFT_645715 [Tirmania nivea]|nr:hypothetical protein EV426DRAFT_645715 [Tirmania nivea]
MPASKRGSSAAKYPATPVHSSPLSPVPPSASGTPQTPTPAKKRVRAPRVQIPVNVEVQEVLSGDEDCEFSEEEVFIEMEKDEPKVEKSKKRTKMPEGPPAKKVKINTYGAVPGKQSSVLLSDLRWVHNDMKEDLVMAFNKSPQEFMNCCNFWYRYCLWKKKDLTKLDREQFVVGAFSVLPSQLHYDPNSPAGGNKPIGIQVHRQWESSGVGQSGSPQQAGANSNPYMGSLQQNISQIHHGGNTLLGANQGYTLGAQSQQTYISLGTLICSITASYASQKQAQYTRPQRKHMCECDYNGGPTEAEGDTDSDRE